MKTDASTDHLAVLIDGDNVSAKVITGLMAEIPNYGTASVKRIYGDWTSPLMKSWRECLLEHSIVPMQQFAYTTGKNATDGAMIIDAMDLLYTGRFSGFCLVSSDSDFTRLAARIREQGVTVYGFGNRDNTHRAFVAACNKFVYFDALPRLGDAADELPTPTPPTKPVAAAADNITTTSTQQPQGSSRQQPPLLPPTGPKALTSHPRPILPWRPAGLELVSSKPLDQETIRNLTLAIMASSVYEEDFANLAEVGDYLTKISPDLNARNYGFPRLLDLVKASGIAEIKMKSRESGPPIAMARLKGQRRDSG